MYLRLKQKVRNGREVKVRSGVTGKYYDLNTVYNLDELSPSERGDILRKFSQGDFEEVTQPVEQPSQPTEQEDEEEEV